MERLGEKGTWRSSGRVPLKKSKADASPGKEEHPLRDRSSGTRAGINTKCVPVAELGTAGAFLCESADDDGSNGLQRWQQWWIASCWAMSNEVI